MGRHAATRREFGFPQANGDIFAFDTQTDREFLHGIYNEKKEMRPPNLCHNGWKKAEQRSELRDLKFRADARTWSMFVYRFSVQCVSVTDVAVILQSSLVGEQ